MTFLHDLSTLATLSIWANVSIEQLALLCFTYVPMEEGPLICHGKLKWSRFCGAGIHVSLQCASASPTSRFSCNVVG
jgi:hypothetical protein